MAESKKYIDFKALFLGSKAENKDYFDKLFHDMYEDVSDWRRNYQISDKETISLDDKKAQNFLYTQEKLESTLSDLSQRLRGGCLPWHSPRYLAHMCSETLVPGILGYFTGLFFNSNNVTSEAGPATSLMEHEVGADLSMLMGYGDKGWGHITTDGSIANLEAVWYARNFKSIGYAVAELYPNEVKAKTDWEKANLSIETILNVMDKHLDDWDKVKALTVRNDSTGINHLGKLFVPRTKHYSWLKAADIMGVGTNNLSQIDVDSHYRMDIDLLEKQLLECIKTKTPILGVVCVVGTTEEGAVDHVDKVVALRKKLAKEHGVWFYLHVDAAYGGYGRTIFLDENNKFIDFDKLHAKYKEYKVFSKHIDWPSRDVYEAYKAIGESDSTTIDPHKMGYVPYAAGGIAIKDVRMKNAISYYAKYTFDAWTGVPILLGSYILEGSKSGAAAAAVWTCHRTIPLNITGYGRLLGHSIEGAYNLYNTLNEWKPFQVNGKTVKVYPLCKPDFNIVDYVFAVEGTKSLKELCDFNENIWAACSFAGGEALYKNDIILSHSGFAIGDYGHSPKPIIDRIGVSFDEYLKGQEITILRTCQMSPWMYDDKVSTYFLDIFKSAMLEKLQKIVK